MDKQVLTFGPWTRGVNYINDPAALKNDELAVGQNIEIDNRGSILLRRPIRRVEDGAPNVRLLGESPLLSEELDKNIGSGIIYRNNDVIKLLYPKGNKLGQFEISTLGTLHTDINYVFTYGKRYYALSTDTTGTNPSYYCEGIGPGAKTWIPIGSTTEGPGLVGPEALGGKIYCDTYAMYLDKLFIAVDDTVYFSKTGDFFDWTINSDGGSFSVSAQSGNRINFFHVMYNMLYIFTKYETYSYTYGTSPNVDPSLQTVSKQGANTAVFFKDRLYCVADDGIYTFLNNMYYPVILTIDIKYHGITSIQGLEDCLVFGSTLPTNQILLANINPENHALVEWPIGGDYLFGIKGTTQNLYTNTEDDVFSYLIVKGNTDVFAVPNVYGVIPANEFYDASVPSSVTDLSPYEALVQLIEVNDKVSTKYHRIYYCSMEGIAHGFYDGSVYISDTYRSYETVKAGTQIDHTIKKRYVVDRARMFQPIINFKPTDAETVPAANMLPIKFELRNFQVVVSAMDIQQGERD